jgi:uncharacterized membrane protein YhaH (DUF805 family)/uncharacterized membrane protein YphA (DoxX/SURF4 family)
MKYVVWFLRLLFASWMIPAGVNHFFPIFPQPMGSQPLSMELISALIDSRLFDLVKAVELLAGVWILVGFYTPLALILCMPVSFCVFFWDAPLEGWGSRAAQFGYTVLACNLLLCLAYVRSYRDMFALRVTPQSRQQLVLAGRILFGAWMLANGINHFFLQAWTFPAGSEPLAMQLMAAFMHSGLLGVAMFIQLVAGALILAGVLVPVALCVVMPVSTCALFWAAVLEQQPLGAVLALAAFALNGLLMLAYLPSYKGALQRYSVSLGETSGGRSVFDSMFVGANGRTSRDEFIPALITLLAVVVFYAFIVKGRTAQFCLLVLLYPAIMLHARRLQDMGHSAWLLAIPAVLMIGAFAIRLKYVSPDAAIASGLPLVALAVSGAFALWGCLGSERRAA